jgi:hypothetical protein
MGQLLKVPYIKQPKNSTKCGAACAAMVIKHYSGNIVSIDDIWFHISAISPEQNREYCRTYKIGAYISNYHFRCVSIMYTCLGELLEFCNTNGIAPIINHRSFTNKTSGHFSVVKNICGSNVIINDPESKQRIVVPLQEIDSLATKSGNHDEIGGNTAIIPIMDKFPFQSRTCPSCGNSIDTSFDHAANAARRIVIQDLCQSCDTFSRM